MTLLLLQELLKNLEFHKSIQRITSRINSAENIREIIVDIKEDIRKLFNIYVLTIYVVDKAKKEIFTLQNGGFAQFDDCVNANRALPSGRFTFAGGVLGLLLVDVPYEDNVVGEGGRNPSWELLRTTCTP